MGTFGFSDEVFLGDLLVSEIINLSFLMVLMVEKSSMVVCIGSNSIRGLSLEIQLLGLPCFLHVLARNDLLLASHEKL